MRSNGTWCYENRQLKVLAICTLLAVSTLLPVVNGWPVESNSQSSPSSSIDGAAGVASTDGQAGSGITAPVGQASVPVAALPASSDNLTASEKTPATAVPDDPEILNQNATSTEGEQPPQQPANNGTEATSSLAQAPVDAATPVETTTVNPNAKQYIHTDPDLNNPPLSLVSNNGTAGEAVANTPAFAAAQLIQSTENTTASDEAPPTTGLDDQASVPTTSISVSTDDPTFSEEAPATAVPDPNATATEGEQPLQQPANNGTETMTPQAQALVAPVETTTKKSRAKQYFPPPGKFYPESLEYVPPGEFDPATCIFTPGRYIPGTTVFQPGHYDRKTEIFTPGRYEANGTFVIDPNNPPLSLASNDGITGQSVASLMTVVSAFIMSEAIRQLVRF